jgi:hypothetical protein
MNRKDLVSLMEAYEDVVLDNQVEENPEDEMGRDSAIEISTSNDDSDIDFGDEGGESFPEADEEQLQEFEEEKNKMVEAHLHTIRSHAHEIHGCLERGALVEPWMEEKIAIANDYIVHVANAIMYKK